MCSKRKTTEQSVPSGLEPTAKPAGDSQLDPGPTSKETPQSQPDPTGMPADAVSKGVRRPSKSKAAGGNKGVEAPLPTNPKSPRADGKSFSSPLISGDPSDTPTEIDDFSRVKESVDPTEPPGLAGLFDQAKDVAQQLRGLKSQTLRNGVKAAGLMFDLGAVLTRLHPTFRRGGWGKQLKARGISTSMDWRSRMLYERACTRDALNDIGISEAYKKFGIHKHAADQSLDRQLAALAKRVEKIGGKQVDADRCRSMIDGLKASLDSLIHPGGESGDSAPVPS